jgi:putative membrane protein
MRLSCCATLALMAACATDGSEAAERQADTTARRDSVAAVSAGSMSEANVLAFLAQVHSADSVVGLLGAQKGSTTEIKDFGRMILREHTALGRDIASIAQRSGIAPQAPRVAPDEPPPAMRDNVVAGAPGAAWDRSYIDYAIAAHISRSDTKQFIEKSVPILQKHLDKAKVLQKRAARQS